MVPSVIGSRTDTLRLTNAILKPFSNVAKTAGQIGYITAKEHFASNVYYRSSATKIKVLRGLNSYANTALTGKRTHYRRNQVIRVKKLVRHNLTTRYQLPNGRYVSANKRLVLRVK